MFTSRLWIIVALWFLAVCCQADSNIAYTTFMQRAGFATPDQRLCFSDQKYAEFVKTALHNAQQNHATLPPPPWSYFDPVRFTPAPPEHVQQQNKVIGQWERELQIWWYNQMLQSQTPLQEQMLLFWHSFLTTEMRVVRKPPLVWRQHQKLRAQALGNFKTIIEELTTDAAMMMYLNLNQNNKKHPNENYARELLELFTMGEGHYSEQDIKELARALTGWKVQPGRVVFQKGDFDNGNKTIFGKTAPFDKQTALNWLFEQPRVAEYLVERLWRYFIGTEPDPSLVKTWAQQLRQDKYEVIGVLNTLFTSDAFIHAPPTVKSPAELAVGLLKHYDIRQFPVSLLPLLNFQLEQPLFNPPNVEGWPNGDSWLNSKSVIARERLTNAISKLSPLTLTPKPAESFQYK